MQLLSDESASEQIAGVLAKRNSRQRFISATYVNTPSIDRRETSPIHHGGLILTVYGNPPTRLVGEYFTERPSKGTLVLRDFSPALVESFEDGERSEFKPLID